MKGEPDEQKRRGKSVTRVNILNLKIKKLNHNPNCIQSYGADELEPDGEPCILFEPAQTNFGAEFHSIMQSEGKPTYEQIDIKKEIRVLKLILVLVSTLVKMHKVDRLAHLNLKPGNVLLNVVGDN